jgi:tetratricopeptide (TPR) repeat protein
MSGRERALQDMRAELPGEPAGRRLNTWKEIAGFFGRDERTVRRWETTRSLPVRRLPSGPRSLVFAYEGELQEWLHRRGDIEPSAMPPAAAETLSARPAWPPLRYAAALAAIAVILIVVSVALRFQQPSPGPIAAPAHPPTAEARSFYEAGLYAWQTRTPESLTRAVDDFTQAIVDDPQYAEAYVGLANCYNLLREYSTMAPDYAFPRAKSAAERAIALNPRLGGAHAALAFVDFHWLRDIKSARREFARAIALAPRDATAHHWYATFLLTIGEYPQAVAQIDQAEALDTASTAIRADRAFILFHAGRTDESFALLRQLEQAQPLFASTHYYLAVIYRARGNNGEYLREFAAFADSRGDDADRAIAAAGMTGLAAGGHVGMLRGMLATERQLFAADKLPAYALAETCADLGDTKNTLAYLRTSLDRRETNSAGLAVAPVFNRLHANPEFRTLAAMAASPAPPVPRQTP